MRHAPTDPRQQTESSAAAVTAARLRGLAFSRFSPLTARVLFAVAVVLCTLSPHGRSQEQPPSPWYLDRGTEVREALPADDIPRVAQILTALLRDGGVPGFYDGQFAGVANDFDALARLALDESVEHTVRVMAVMAMQEAADGEVLLQKLEPLLVSAAEEFSAELNDYRDVGYTVDEPFVRRGLRADLSRHVRFALAKDGQAEAVLEKIEVMEFHIRKHKGLILDRSVKSDKNPKVMHYRSIWFDIAYHYQQYDDYENAALWFQQLCDNLTGDETRWAHYNLACMAAIQGKNAEALRSLRSAYEAGFLDVFWMLEDGDLAPVRHTPEFLELAREMGATDATLAEKSGPAPEGPEQPESAPETP